MVTKQSNSMTPVKLRLLLISTLCLTIVASGGLFWLFRENVIIVKAQDVQKVSTDAKSRDNEAGRLESVQKILERDKDIVSKAQKIAADTKFYQYQDQILKDLSSFAKTSGVIIQRFDFNDTATTPGAAKPVSGGVADPAGLKSVSVSITVANPVPFDKLMRFIHAIEANVTKMQLDGISISATKTSDVTVNTLTIKVFTK